MKKRLCELLLSDLDLMKKSFRMGNIIPLCQCIEFSEEESVDLIFILNFKFNSGIESPVTRFIVIFDLNDRTLDRINKYKQFYDNLEGKTYYGIIMPSHNNQKIEICKQLNIVPIEMKIQNNKISILKRH